MLNKHTEREFDSQIWRRNLANVENIIEIKVIEDKSQFKNKYLCILFDYEGFKLYAVRDIKFVSDTEQAIGLIEEFKNQFIHLLRTDESEFLYNYIQNSHLFTHLGLIYDINLLKDFKRYFSVSSYSARDILKHIEQHKDILSYLNFVCQRF